MNRSESTSPRTPQIRQSLRKQAFEITSTVNYTQNENLTLAGLIEDQMFGETCDRHAAGATKFVCREATAWPNSRTLSNPQQRGSDRLFPTLRQTPICLSFVPIRRSKISAIAASLKATRGFFTRAEPVHVAPRSTPSCGSG